MSNLLPGEVLPASSPTSNSVSQSKNNTTAKYRWFFVLDVLLAVSILSLGIYAGSLLYITIGLVSCVISFFQPTKRIEAYVLKRIVSR